MLLVERYAIEIPMKRQDQASDTRMQISLQRSLLKNAIPNLQSLRQRNIFTKKNESRNTC